MQPGHQHSSGAMLKIMQRQAQEVAKDAAAEDRIDAVARVDQQILAQPAEACREQECNREAHPNHRERAHGVMHDHLVDDHLRQYRRRKAENLQRRGNDQDIAPDVLVPQKRRQKPLQPELLGLGAEIRILGTFSGALDQQHVGFEELLEVRGGDRVRNVAARFQIKQAVGIGPQDQCGFGRSGSCSVGRIGR